MFYLMAATLAMPHGSAAAASLAQPQLPQRTHSAGALPHAAYDRSKPAPDLMDTSSFSFITRALE